jgi:hypothetical protein
MANLLLEAAAMGVYHESGLFPEPALRWRGNARRTAGPSKEVHMRFPIGCALVVIIAAVVATAADPTPEDFALRILPEQIVLPDSPDEATSVDLEVTVSTAIAGVQGWSFGILAENNGLTQFYIENAREHPDLQAVAGEDFTLYSIFPGRPTFDAINFYVAGQLDRIGAMARTPNTEMDPHPEHDTADGVPGTWAAVIQGCIIDFGCKLELPVTENFGVMALRVKAQGQAPNSGRLVFSKAIGTPPVDVTFVWNGYSYEPHEKADDVYIPPAIQSPSTISFGSAPAGQFIRGDSNGDGELTIADPVTVLSYLFGSDPTSSCVDALDVNDDGSLNIADPIALLSFLFGNGAEPDPPYGACGIDPTEDRLDCQSSAACP